MRKTVKETKGANHNVPNNGLDAVVRSWGDLNHGFQAIASEMTDYSKSAFHDASQAFEQIIGSRSVGHIIEIQTQYAKTTYENHLAEMSKLGQMYLRLVERRLSDRRA